MVIGIDLGTTNCALAWTTGRQPVRVFDVPQLVARDETAALPTLPSFLLRSANGSDFVAGAYARDEGALTPGRQIASAKSWLANPRVDRTAAILPWSADAADEPPAQGPASPQRLSPVEASARLLGHLRDAWNRERPSGAEPLEQQPVVLTVPASFDEEARELTAEAARLAGLQRFTLLEEPLAALYAWIAAHRRDITGALGDGRLILVCDVGGGTTDFSLIRATVDGDDLGFERVAIGEHLLLGGDNLDLALAALVEGRLDGARLTLVQRQSLRRRCSAAKERLLSDPSLGQVPITILGSGRGVVGGGITTRLTIDDVRTVLDDGFLPLTSVDDLPARDRRIGLRELGLPYESEPAITRHLAAFLSRAGEGEGLARPDAVLFNGGFFTPAGARERVLDALAGWLGVRPMALENTRPEAAVAVGAAFYGRLRQDPAASRRLLIRAGSARSYYVGVDADAGESAGTAVCILPRGTDEGTRFALERRFVIQTNRPAAFTLYSSRFRTDTVGDLVTFAPDEEVERHAPLIATLRYGKRSRSVPLDVRLATTFTETGTLELWCEAVTSEHRWRLAFNLRGAEADPLEADEGADDPDASGVVIAEPSIDAAMQMLRELFAPGATVRAPQAVTGDLETTLGHARADWPLPVLRRLADVLIELEPGRAKAPAYEVRWLNLVGFCLRPGFGSASDEWRVSELRKVYAAGPAFAREVQNQVEWIVLWGRVGAGFTAGQQAELAQRTAAQLGLSGRKGPRLNPQIERESWRLLAALERLAPAQKVRFGDELLMRIARDPRNTTWAWALGRLGARSPLYGPLNTVIPPSVAVRWIDALLAAKLLTPDLAAAIAQIGARTGDPARDIDESVASAAADRLEAAGHAIDASRLLQIVAPDTGITSRTFGESLPHGLRLQN